MPRARARQGVGEHSVQIELRPHRFGKIGAPLDLGYRHEVDLPTDDSLADRRAAPRIRAARSDEDDRPRLELGERRHRSDRGGGKSDSRCARDDGSSTHATAQIIAEDGP